MLASATWKTYLIPVLNIEISCPPTFVVKKSEEVFATSHFNLFCFWLIYWSIQELKKEDDIVVLAFSDISSVLSIGGIVIAVLQIFKVADNTKTYKEACEKTISTVLNNKLCDTILPSAVSTNLLIYGGLLPKMLPVETVILSYIPICNLATLLTDINVNKVTVALP